MYHIEASTLMISYLAFSISGHENAYRACPTKNTKTKIRPNTT